MRAALIYGSSSGKTEYVVPLLQEELRPELEVELLDVGILAPADLARYGLLLLAIPTWDIGQLEYNWQEMCDKMEGLDLSGVRIAMIGLGDQENYPDTYQDAMGMLYEFFLAHGAVGGLGFMDTHGHVFEESRGVIGDQFCGLALDEDNQPGETEPRIAAWAGQLKRELGLTVI